jgi:hypothetical protein
MPKRYWIPGMVGLAITCAVPAVAQAAVTESLVNVGSP